jgi:EmrB/QacA subfamily drug resistance transporter
LPAPNPTRSLPTAQPRPHLWGWTVGLVATATFMLILDLTVVNVALPEIQRSFHARLTELEWMVNTYALFLAGLLLIGGSTADRIGRRLVFLVGMAIFTLGSLLSAIAPSAVLLIVFRGFQGVGASLLFATALGILGNLFQGRERVQALGVWGIAIGAGLAVGPLVGGLLTQLFGWPAIFIVNVPIGVAVVALSLWRMPESRDPHPHRIDGLGAALQLGTLLSLIYALVQGNDAGWDSPEILGAFAAAIVLASLFVLAERRPQPMADLGLLKDARFRAASIGVFGQGVVVGAMLFYLVRFLQEGLGDSPLIAGLEILPMTVTAMGGALIGSRLAPRFRVEWMMCGALGLMGAGSLLMLLCTLARGWLWLLPGMLLAGLGWGAINPASAHAALEAADQEQTGMASGFVNTARQVGIASGLGGLGAIFELEVRTHAFQRLSSLAPAARTLVSVLAARDGLGPAVQAAGRPSRELVAHVVRSALLSGVDGVLLGAGLGALIAGFVIVLSAGHSTERPNPKRAAG